MSMSCPNGRKEFNNSSGRGKAINDLHLLRSPAPACDPTSPNDKGGAERSEYALPAALAASGIPRIVVLDENAVYDHYMRRLNRVWMKRIKVRVRIHPSYLRASFSRALYTSTHTRPFDAASPYALQLLHLKHNVRVARRLQHILVTTGRTRG